MGNGLTAAVDSLIVVILKRRMSGWWVGTVKAPRSIGA